MKTRFLFIFSILIIAHACKKVITNAPVVAPPVEDTVNLKSYHKNITIVNWNIEWFGSSEMFSGNLGVQEANAAKILKYLNADLYGICEVVDTARFGHMVRTALGDEFRYKISYYPTMAGSQKLAFVYNRHIFRNVTVRPFLGLSANAYYYFAQRFPFLLKAEVVVNDKRNLVHFFLLHAKANADNDSYTRRLNGSVEMKDSLDRHYSGKYIMIIGDYNDHLSGSIVAGRPSPYQNFVNDAGYDPVTLPLNTTGYQSTIYYPNSVIDQQMISSNMSKWYIASSAKIRTDVTQPVPDFNTANTSDHYPVSSMYNIR